MKPLYIFDLDGTLANCEHRQPILGNKDDPDRWNKFFDACVDDKPIWPVIDTLQRLRASGCDVLIFSGRSDRARKQTERWLTDIGLHHIHVRMRPDGDFTADDELKLQWLNELTHAERRRLVAVFDDRDKVVAMWRANGVACFQVAPGAF